MKILFVSGVYVPASGGSEISIHSLLSELVAKGHEVKVLTGPDPDGTMSKYVIDNVSVMRIGENSLKREFFRIVEIYSPAIILTQLMWSERVLLWSREAKLKTGYFVRSTGNNLDLSDKSSISPDLIFSNSEVTRKYVRDVWDRESILVYPIIKLSDYESAEKRTPIFITMFNPIEIKGGEIFRRLAQLMPDREFMAVKGWQHWKKPNSKEWDLEKMKSNAKAFGDDLVIPKEVDFEDLNNVYVQPATNNVVQFYNKTRLLLVPSQWQEAFGRVVLEAMVNGIPVIGSLVGALAEVIGKGGLVVADFSDASSWVEAIKYFDDKQLYDRASLLARKEAVKYDYKKEVTKVESSLVKVFN